MRHTPLGRLERGDGLGDGIEVTGLYQRRDQEYQGQTGEGEGVIRIGEAMPGG